MALATYAQYVWNTPIIKKSIDLHSLVPIFQIETGMVL